MAYGFRARTATGFIQIDDQGSGIVVVQKGMGSSIPRVDLTQNMVFVRPVNRADTDSTVTFALDTTSNTGPWPVVDLAANPVMVEYVICQWSRYITATPSGYGLTVNNSSGQTVYSSSFSTSGNGGFGITASYPNNFAGSNATGPTRLLTDREVYVTVSNHFYRPAPGPTDEIFFFGWQWRNDGILPDNSDRGVYVYNRIDFYITFEGFMGLTSSFYGNYAFFTGEVI